MNDLGVNPKLAYSKDYIVEDAVYIRLSVTVLLRSEWQAWLGFKYMSLD